QGKLRERTPGEPDRLQVAPRPGEDHDGKENHRSLLRHRPEILVLERLLRRRTTGDEGSAALPAGFRRHHRGRAGSRLDRACGTGGASREGIGEDRVGAPVTDPDATAPPGGGSGVRWPGRPEGWPDPGPGAVQV